VGTWLGLSNVAKGLTGKKSIERNVVGAIKQVGFDPTTGDPIYARKLQESKSEISESGLNSLLNGVYESFAGIKIAKHSVPGFTPGKSAAAFGSLLGSGRAVEIITKMGLPESVAAIPGKFRFRQQLMSSAVNYGAAYENMDERMQSVNAINTPEMNELYGETELLNKMPIRSRFKEGDVDESHRERLRSLGFEPEKIEELVANGGEILREALTSPVLYGKGNEWWKQSRIIVTDDVKQKFTDLWENIENYSPEVQNKIRSALAIGTKGPFRDANGLVQVGDLDTRMVGHNKNYELSTGFYQGTVGQEITSMLTDKQFRHEAFIENIPKMIPEIYASGDKGITPGGRSQYIKDSYDFFAQIGLLKSIPDKKVGIKAAKGIKNTILTEMSYRKAYGKNVLSDAEVLKMSRLFNLVMSKRVARDETIMRADLDKSLDYIGNIKNEVGYNPNVLHGSYRNYNEETGMSTIVPYQTLSTLPTMSEKEARKLEGSYINRVKELSEVIRPKELLQVEKFISGIEKGYAPNATESVNAASIYDTVKKLGLNEDDAYSLVNNATTEAYDIGQAFSPESKIPATLAVSRTLFPPLKKAIASVIPDVAPVISDTGVGRSHSPLLNAIFDISSETGGRTPLMSHPIGITDPDVLMSMLESGAITDKEYAKAVVLSAKPITDQKGTRWEKHIPRAFADISKVDFSSGFIRPPNVGDEYIQTRGSGPSRLYYSTFRGMMGETLSVMAENAARKKQDLRRLESERVLDKLAGSHSIQVDYLKGHKVATGANAVLEEGKVGNLVKTYETYNKVSDAIGERHSDIIKPGYVPKKTISRNRILGEYSPETANVRYNRDIGQIIGSVSDYAGMAKDVGGFKDSKEALKKAPGIISKFLNIWGPRKPDTWKSSDARLFAPGYYPENDVSDLVSIDFWMNKELERVWSGKTPFSLMPKGENEDIKGSDIFGLDFTRETTTESSKDFKRISRDVMEKSILQSIKESDNPVELINQMHRSIEGFNQWKKEGVEGTYPYIPDYLALSKSPGMSSGLGTSLFDWLTKGNTKELSAAFSENEKGYGTLSSMLEEVAEIQESGMLNGKRIGKDASDYDVVSHVINKYRTGETGEISLEYLDAVNLVSGYRPLRPEYGIQHVNPYYKGIPRKLSEYNPRDYGLGMKSGRSSVLTDLYSDVIDYSKGRSIGFRLPKFGKGTPNINGITLSGKAFGLSVVGDGGPEISISDDGTIRTHNTEEVVNFRSPTTVIPKNRLPHFAFGTPDFNRNDIIRSIAESIENSFEEYNALGSDLLSTKGVTSTTTPSEIQSIKSVVAEHMNSGLAKSGKHPERAGLFRTEGSGIISGIGRFMDFGNTDYTLSGPGNVRKDIGRHDIMGQDISGRIQRMSDVTNITDNRFIRNKNRGIADVYEDATIPGIQKVVTSLPQPGGVAQSGARLSATEINSLKDMLGDLNASMRDLGSDTDYGGFIKSLETSIGANRGIDVTKGVA